MGKVFRFQDNVDTDQIIPAKFLVTTDMAELAKGCMEPVDPDFPKKVKPGDVVVAGRNFGCGSSREHAPLALKGCGVSCVIAKSFARIYLRNSINIGLPALECPEAVDALHGGEEVTVDPAAGTIAIRGGATYTARPLPEFVMGIVKAGGLMPFVKQRLSQKGAGS
ncbi:MAG: 3-isopropylmalate dehydratase small subunit [Candidatus Coatesbacteria bacterium]